MGFKKDENFSFDVIDYLGSIKENEKHDWCKSVARIKWGDNPTTIDIRSMNMANKRIGKGISLTNEETDKLVDLLLENDFGTTAALEECLRRRKEIFTISEEDIDKALDDRIYIDIKLDE